MQPHGRPSIAARGVGAGERPAPSSGASGAWRGPHLPRGGPGPAGCRDAGGHRRRRGHDGHHVLRRVGRPHAGAGQVAGTNAEDHTDPGGALRRCAVGPVA